MSARYYVVAGYGAAYPFDSLEAAKADAEKKAKNGQAAIVAVAVLQVVPLERPTRTELLTTDGSIVALPEVKQ